MKRRFSTTLSKCFFVFLAVTAVRAWSAPCCAGGSSVPGLITGDDRFLLSSAVTFEESNELARANGDRVKKSAADGGQTLTLRSTGVFADSWQFGFELPLVRRYQDVRSGAVSSTGLGDISLVGGYELISDTTYSTYRPKVILYSRFLAPTGRAIYEITNFGKDLPLGKGFPEWGGGVVAIKSWGRWDVTLNGQINWVLGRTFTADGSKNQFDSTYSWGGGLAVGYLFRFLPIRVATSASYLELGHRDVHFQGTTSLVSARSVWDTAVTLGARWTDEWSTHLVYNDQTILPGRGADLSRSISVSIQRNFPL